MIKRGRTNWAYILIIASVASFTVGFFFLLADWLPKPALSMEVVINPKPLLHGIDQNFLTQVQECFLPMASAYGYTLRITSGYRSMDEQDALYEQGRSTNGHIVSWAPVGQSVHNFGFAVDVVDRWRGYDIDWKKIARMAAFCGLQQVDDPHFEYRGGLTTTQMAAGNRPYPLFLPCALMDQRAKANQPLTKEDLKVCGAPDFTKNVVPTP